MPLTFKLADINLHLTPDPKLGIDNFLAKYLQPIATEKPNISISLKSSENKKYSFQIISQNLGIIIIPKLGSLKDYETMRFLIKAFVDFFASSFNIMLLHGSSVMIDSQVYIFIGPSGVGKSTIINLLPKKHHYSDDIAVIKQINNKYYLYNPIFEPVNPKFQNQAFPIKKIFVLKQSKENKHKVIRLNKTKALVELIESNFQHNLMSYFPKYKDSVLYQRTVSQAKMLNQTVPVYTLSFYKHKSVLNAII